MLENLKSGKVIIPVILGGFPSYFSQIRMENILPLFDAPTVYFYKPSPITVFFPVSHASFFIFKTEIIALLTSTSVLFKDGIWYIGSWKPLHGIVVKGASFGDEDSVFIICSE